MSKTIITQEELKKMSEALTKAIEVNTQEELAIKLGHIKNMVKAKLRECEE